MHTKLLTIGTIYLLLTIFLSGCIKEKNEENIINISLEELINHTDEYIGLIVTTNGYIDGGLGEESITSYITDLCDSNSTTPKYCILLNIPINITIKEGMYKITGILGIHNMTSIPVINVTKAEYLL